MKITGFAILLVLAFSSPVMSQTISGYADGEATVNSHDDAPPKTKPIEYPGTPIDGWQATLRLLTNSFQVASNIEAEIIIKNVSTKELKLSAAWPLLANGFNVQVLDKNKVEIPLTSLGKTQKSSGDASPNISRSLPPGNEMVFSLELRKLYQLESPGAYSIQATKVFPSPDGAKKVQVATGVAQITIQSGTDAKKN